VLQKPEVTAPIIGASRLEHFDDVVASLSLKLTPEEIATLEEPYTPRPVWG
jgi:aryl-alcohol dehydrogenase-like predicted oxidoreductase